MKGCLYDYMAKPKGLPVLQCIAHPRCHRQVVLWRNTLLEELGSGGRLGGAALADWEKGKR